MTDFVLVSGGMTGGWIWRDVAEGLRAGGHRAYPVTLTGMGDRRHLAGPETNLDTHVEDIVQVLDNEQLSDVVLVGHCYGIFPTLAAADRRPERIAHLVYLDAPLPVDGESVLGMTPDEEMKERMLRRAEESGKGRLVPPPPLDDSQWGSLEGIAEQERERLSLLAAPQPLGTLEQPLRLTGSHAELPSTGICCTANGMTVEVVRSLVATSDDPRFRRLADPRVGLFDLATGHWPMLSCPQELTELLVRAAAGEGERLTV